MKAIHISQVLECIEYQLSKVRLDIEQLECKLCEIESSENFNGVGSQYSHLVVEKRNLNDQLLQLLKALVDFASPSSEHKTRNVDSSDECAHVIAAETPITLEESSHIEAYIDRNPDNNSFNPVKHDSQHVKKEDETHVTSVVNESLLSNSSSAISPLQRKRKHESDCNFTSQKSHVNKGVAVAMEQYREDKALVAHIMREFSARRCKLLDVDGKTPICLCRHTDIKQLLRENPNRQLSDYIRGETKSYRVSYNKKTQTFSENKLFIPHYIEYK